MTEGEQVRSEDGVRRPMRAVSFQLAQLGAHATQRFAERIADLGLTPPDVGLLRMIASEPGRSQRSLAAELGVVPSRVVTLIDQLDEKGLVERRRSAKDRRNHELYLTGDAERLLGRMAQLAIAHEDDLCGVLDDDEYEQLATLLRRIAGRQGLAPGVHPGYKTMSGGASGG
ncbi:MarR family winged helix-turn-helix transcriptional regulator [Nocardia sp. NPDC051463]|uniref:MarR family winged helix-turn-helix transcriptional regulator n=1 Tax=Nocardia sp. NPDC051463 TaxID=3154845 RepID=UPI00344C634D